MRRLILTLAVAAVAGGWPLAADLALARDKAARWEVQDRGRDRGPPPGWERRRGPDGARSDRYGGPPPRAYRRDDGPRQIRPGGHLPRSFRGAPVYDYPRYRLRPPPHGYAWYRVGNAFLLVSLADGQVFDMVVD